MLLIIKPKIKIFISYAHANQEYFDVFYEKLKNFSSNSNKFRWEIWTDKDILVGDKWFEEIKKKVHSSDCAIFLSSPEFKKSRFIKKNELKEFLEREVKEGIRIIPILLTDAKVSLIPELKGFQFYKAIGRDYGRPSIGDKPINFSEIVKSNKSYQDTNEYINRYIKSLISEIEAPVNPYSFWSKKVRRFLLPILKFIIPSLLALVLLSWIYFMPTQITGVVTVGGGVIEGEIYQPLNRNNERDSDEFIKDGKFNLTLDERLSRGDKVQLEIKDANGNLFEFTQKFDFYDRHLEIELDSCKKIFTPQNNSLSTNQFSHKYQIK